MLFSIILATFIISLISFVGIFLVFKKVEKFLHYFISFAAGSLLAVAFFDLIPESIAGFEAQGISTHYVYVIVGIVLFFLVERFIHWHHCGQEECHSKPVGLLNLTGDAVHNFIDGVLVAGAFLLNFTTGIVTTVSVILHEIPQELGDFSVLIHAGYSKKKAFLYNFYSALFSVLGGVIGYFALAFIKNLIPFAIAIAGGGFLYIALADIVPDLHKHNHNKKVLVIETLIFLSSLILFYFIIIH